MDDRTRVLVLGTADWNQPIATNQHYVARELCSDERLAVTFVESLGLRRPTLSRRDVSRMARRLVSSTKRRLAVKEVRQREVPQGLTVCSPLVLPFHRGVSARVNRRLLSHEVSSWVRDPGPKVLWTYSPVTYGLEAFADTVYYHCVDLLGEFEGVDRTVIEDGEARLAGHGVRAIASSGAVKDHLKGVGFRDVLLWENVADTLAISSAAPMSSSRVEGRVIFAGNLSPKKVDYAILKQLASAGIEVVVAGPRSEGGGNDGREFHSLLEAGVHYLGMLSMNELADELASACVGIIPYQLNPYTLGVSPLKTFEYLAAGLSVVSTALPGVSAVEGHVWIEKSAQEFVNRVKEVAIPPSEEIVLERTELADMHSWSRRGAEVRGLVRQGCEK